MLIANTKLDNLPGGCVGAGEDGPQLRDEVQQPELGQRGQAAGLQPEPGRVRSAAQQRLEVRDHGLQSFRQFTLILRDLYK